MNVVLHGLVVLVLLGLSIRKPGWLIILVTIYFTIAFIGR